MKLEVYRYVRHCERAAFEASGWVCRGDLPGPHGEYSCLMEYPEMWAPVVGYEGLYSVSSHGRVMSHDRRVRTLSGGLHEATRVIRGRVLKPRLVKGYEAAQLTSKDGGRRPRYVAHMVAEAFIGPRPEGRDVCHSDGDRRNNCAFNLRYDTHAANMQDAIAHGVLPRGERIKASRLTAEKVVEIRVRAMSENAESLAEEYGVGVMAIHKVINGQTWRHVECPSPNTLTPEGQQRRKEYIAAYRARRLAKLNKDRANRERPPS